MNGDDTTILNFKFLYKLAGLHLVVCNPHCLSGGSEL